VVKLNSKDEIVELVEKPQEFVSDQAVIGIYYFKEGLELKASLQKVLDANLMHGGEYQINDGIKDLMSQGKVFKTEQQENLVHSSVRMENSEIIAPCFIGKNVTLINVRVGPNVSIGADCELKNVQIDNSLVQCETEIINAKLTDSMIGNKVKYNGEYTSVSIGDYSVFE